MKKTKSNEVNLEMNVKQITFKIKGVTPLIVNKFTEKAKVQMEEIQQKKSKKREIDDPEKLYLNTLYFFPDGKRTGFPAVGFKAAMTRAGKQVDLVMTDTRGKFHVMGTEGSDLIEIKGTPTMRTDMVRVASGGAMIRYRAEYKEWEASVRILYNEQSISAEQLGQLLMLAGFSCGIGEWRPEKSNSGSFGMFEIMTE